MSVGGIGKVVRKLKRNENRAVFNKGAVAYN